MTPISQEPATEIGDEKIPQLGTSKNADTKEAASTDHDAQAAGQTNPKARSGS